MLEVRQVPMGGDVRDFLDVVSYIYAADPAFIRPLDQDLRDRLNPKKNPLFEHAEGTIFLAYRNGKCVGTITATIDHEHLARYKDGTLASWASFDTVDDAEVAGEALSRARRGVAPRQGYEARSRAGVDVDQRGGRVPRRGVRLTARLSEPASPPVPGAAHRGGGVREAEGFLRLALHRRRAERARQARARRRRGSPRGEEPDDEHEGRRTRCGDHRRCVQRRMERQLGLRPAHEERSSEDGRRLQADPRARAHAYRHDRR